MTSQYDTTTRSIFDQLQNRQAFQYNASDDAMYQQYVDRYMRQGQKAMMDTIGQASAATGGYTNSYAQSQGQKQYNQYLTDLNDKMMDTYDLAYNQYQNETSNLYNLFNASSAMGESEANRWYQDQMLALQWAALNK